MKAERRSQPTNFTVWEPTKSLQDYRKTCTVGTGKLHLPSWVRVFCGAGVGFVF